MRYATLSIIFALIIHKEGATPDSDFKPIPIPLEPWNHKQREARVGTLQETVNSDKATTVAAVPAYYWEDALRHSVYLTLVRDKIDQLIAKRIVVSPNTKPEQHSSKEVDDHDLWEKIKKAPFDRIQEEDNPSYGDVTIMAKGRLLEENGSFRFAEDERTKEDCKEEKCMKGVKAFWSVKRVRQRDEEISTGKYHYELTFSVNSQPPKKQRKPYETPVRTFTLRENPPDIIVASPEEQPHKPKSNPQGLRPQRAIWFHKNIAPAPRPIQARYHHQGLERIFSSFFSDDDSHAEPQPRYKPNPYAPPLYSHYSKVGHVGPSRDQQHQKRIMQYPYTPNINKYPRPPLPAPPMSHAHHYIDIDAIANHPHIPPPSDHRYISTSNIIKTTRPAVLPTPSVTSHNVTMKNVSFDFYSDNPLNTTENITSQPELPPVYKPYNKPRQPSNNFNYFPDRIRPPVYNAPPGVFVTMDKRPFKPMPPLKHMHGSKPAKRPIDFRPSPQVLDGQNFNSDTTVESAFRPILINQTENVESDKNKDGITQDSKQSNKHLRKGANKPPKKHENIKSQRATTTAPDIITVYNGLEEDKDTMQWANILSAFTKTTPMASQKDKQVIENTTQPIAHNSFDVTTKKSTTPTTNSSEETTISSISTPIPTSNKRTRPPPKFTKPEKVKKHKRITTTTMSPEKTQKKTADLTPQASSATNGGNKSWQPKDKTVSTTSSTTTTSTTIQKPSSTAQTTTTSTVPPSSTAAQTETITKLTELKNKNRFRQSTLLIKGTSVKHDRWSINANGDKKGTATTSKQQQRRKGSNFQGYRSTSTPVYANSEEFTREYESDTKRKTELTPTYDSQHTPQPTQTTYEETADHYINNESTAAYSKNDEDSDNDRDDIEIKTSNNDEHDIEDHSEFIFDLTSNTPNDKSNEVNEEDLIVTEQSVVATSHSVSKNKTKCKKKKNQHLLSTESLLMQEEPSTTTASPTKSSSDLDILDELLGNLNYEESTTKATESKRRDLDEEESENREKYLQIDDDFEDFLDSLGSKHRHSDEKGVEEYEDDEKEPSFDDEASPFDNDDVNEPRNSDDKDYDDYHERSYSLLELMAME